MSTCGSLRHIFENNNPLPENPTLLESLSWSQIKPVKSIESSSCTEIFGELHFKESPQPSSSSYSSPTPHVYASFSDIDHNKLSQKGVFSGCDINQSHPSSSSSAYVSSTPITNHTNNSHKSGESLQLCTEGLGFESSDDVEDLKASGVNELCLQIQSDHENDIGAKRCATSEEDSNGECRTRVNNEGEYPPPISCIGRSTGKPRVSFRSYRKNGRFVLREITIPTQELLHAHREDGRLKLHFVQADDDVEEEEEEEDYDDVEGVEEGEDNMVK